MSNNQTRPNLFSYATSELSQDAFICWLAEWADPKYKYVDAALHQTATKFIASLIHKHKPGYDVATIETVDVDRQVEKLDILIEINKSSGERKLAILIEDKTHTNNHSDQLNRYYGKIKEYGYDESQMVPIYFKTGYQSKFDTLGIFKNYPRRDFLKVLREESKNVKNAIYEDFLQHLEEMDSVIQRFSTKRLQDWQSKDWIGFFMVLYESRPKLYEPVVDDGANWDYVPNPEGGFYGFWWYFKKLQDKSFTPYLQLEQNSLCFKIKVEDATKRAQAREETYYKLKEVYPNLVRPKRMGNGLYMTVARWDSDYREKKEDSTLDFEATLENLKKAQQILDTAFPQ